MSLEKAIEHGKEKREKYYGSKSFDWTCRNHGSCAYCRNNRTAKNVRQENIAEFKYKDFENGITI